MDPSDIVNGMTEFFDTNYKKELLKRVSKGEHVLEVAFPQLAEFDHTLAQELLDDPDEVVKAAEIAVLQMELAKSVKRFRVRFSDLPKDAEKRIRNIRATHLGKLLMMKGIVRSKTDVLPEAVSARYECPTCGTVSTMLQLDSVFKEPTRCSCGRKGRFRLISKELVDVQFLTLEESPEDLEGGEQPKRLTVVMKEDLVSPFSERRTNPGSKILVIGVTKEVPEYTQGGQKRKIFKLIFEANNFIPMQEDYTQIIPSEEEEAQIRDLAKDPHVYGRLSQSLAPSIYGHERVKEALVLQLFGGVHKVRDDGVRGRGDIHILLVGDPGAGKCLHGDTKVMLSSGEIVPIRSVAENVSPFVEQRQTDNLRLPSLFFDGRMRSQEGICVWKRKEENLLRITTRTGKTLLVTGNHPLFIPVEGYIIAAEAQELREGDRIATPRHIQLDGEVQVLPPYAPKRYSNNSKTYRYPLVVDERLARLLGYLTGDGYVAYSETSGWISLTNNDEGVLQDFEALMWSLFEARLTRRSSHKGKSAREAYVTSRALVDFLKQHFPELFGGSSEKSVPRLLLCSRNEVLASFIHTLFECDAYVNVKKRQLEYSTISAELADILHIALLRFGIVALKKEKLKHATNTLEKRAVKAYELVIGGEFVSHYAKNIGFVSRRKRGQLRQLMDETTYHNTNIDLVPGVNRPLRRIREEAGFTQHEMGIPRPSYAHYDQNNRLPGRVTLQKILRHLHARGVRSLDLERLTQFAGADVFWDEIVGIQEMENPEEFVYDLEIEHSHNYIANGVVVHNSQILKRIQLVAPKSRYVSGKGASGVGLTAAVVKDEFIKGYSLEAGALVLCNNGLCCIDEFDKMSDEDRNTIHEALEQQTVSIAKANIQATLLARTTVLAAANPKYGRFDPYQILVKQIELSPTLIDRFDLIFTIRDIPSLQMDQDMARFILEKLHQQKGVVKPEMSSDFLKKYVAFAKQNYNPVLTDEAVREIQEFYVSLRNKETITGGREIRSVPISPRHLEGLVRLAEASARVQLRKKVTKEDARRAINLLQHCLQSVATDPETGRIDIDLISTGVSASQRSRLKMVQDIISELAAAGQKDIPIDDIVSLGKEKGLKEGDIEETIETLKRHGEIFEPKRGSIQKL